jgi:hypothetical protein
VQPRWDFSNSTASGKWGTAQQCYTFKRTIVGENPGDPYDYGQDVLSSRLKLRGSGKGLSLYFYSEDGKDAYLLGWGLLVSGGSAV